MSAAGPARPSSTQAFEVRGSRRTHVRIGPGVLADLVGVLGGRRAHLVADEHVLALHGQRLADAGLGEPLCVPRGEAAKTWPALGDLLERLASRRVERGHLVVAFGGGATSDAAGLAAALYRRGIPWIVCPTTLLAQVDAALGGKTAVDLPQAKNLVGAFHAPEAVLADTEVLGTLEPRERLSGLGEVLKYAVGLVPDLFVALEADGGVLARAARQGEAGALGALIGPCAEAKGRLVAADEFERGPREALNLGHTLGHAIETAAGHGAVPHGVAVAAGLGFALQLSAELGLLEDPHLPGRTAALAHQLGLPAGLADWERDLCLTLDDRALLNALAHDKKTRGGKARFVLPRALGRLELGVEVEPARIAGLLARRSSPGRAP